MSRVERHKNEYSKADREAVEKIKPSDDSADLKFAYGKSEKAAEPASVQAKPVQGADYEVTRKGRAARRKYRLMNPVSLIRTKKKKPAPERKPARWETADRNSMAADCSVA